MSARDARRLGTAIISHTCARTRQLKLESYDRLFPNQAELTELAHQNVMYEMGTLTAVLFQHGSPTSTTRVEWPIYRDESTRPTSNASVGR